METQKRYDLIISGVGNSAGGVYANVSINGQGKINGDVDCNDFTISGIGNVDGNVKMETGKISGKGRIQGDLKANELRVSGFSQINGSVDANTMKSEGVVNIHSNLTTETLENKGVLSVTGDSNSETFISKGSFSVGGLLNAGTIEISLYAPCKAKEIGGEQIKVKMEHSFHFRRFIKSIFPSLDINPGLTVDTIEGDEIYLEYTRAKVVRGNNVTIGEGCEIERVEYKGRFDQSEKSIVKENTKLG